MINLWRKIIKILLTSTLNSENPVIDGLYNRLCQNIHMEASIDYFWDTDLTRYYDIIHIQWPEQLFHWQPIDDKNIKKLSIQLKFWKNKGTKLLITRHNILPHTLNTLYNEAYKIIYSYADAVIHFSNASVDNFNTMYNPKEIHPIHRIIFHPMYTDIKNDSNKKSAKNYLNINKNKKVILIFGTLRNEQERQFSLSVFNNLDIKNKLLLVPRWYGSGPSKRAPLKWILFQIRTLLDKFNDELMLNQHFVPEEEVQMYMNAADVVFIPRFEVLNSGVLLLAYSFNKIVVGPSTGSIGELLSLSGNPSYEVGNVHDATLKIKQGLKLSNKKVNNYNFAEKYMNWDQVINKHLQLYKEIINE